jgi:hypothetical protein
MVVPDPSRRRTDSDDLDAGLESTAVVKDSDGSVLSDCTFDVTYTRQ